MPGGEIKGCPACRRVILIPLQAPDALCPLCYQAELVPQAGLVRLQPPEIYLPAALSEARVMEVLIAFTEKVPFKVDDLDANKMRSRLRLLWWPQWLVDGDLQGQWSGTFGFDYQARPHMKVTAIAAGNPVKRCAQKRDICRAWVRSQGTMITWSYRLCAIKTFVLGRLAHTIATRRFCLSRTRYKTTMSKCRKLTRRSFWKLRKMGLEKKGCKISLRLPRRIESGKSILRGNSTI